MTVTTTNDTSRPTAYSRLAAALAGNAYVRGGYIGDGPADPSNRRNTNFRIVKTTHNGQRDGLPALAVRYHRANIITATQDGRLILDCGGWEGSSTTKAYLNVALRKYNCTGYMGTSAVFGLRHVTVTMAGNTYLYYSGMAFDNEGTLLTEPQTFQANRIDTVRSKQFMADVTASGFKAMFPVLHAVQPPTMTTQTYQAVRDMRDAVCDAELASQWPDIIMSAAYSRIPYSYPSVYVRGDAKQCWASLMKDAKHDMYEVVDSTTTVIHHNIKPVFTRATPSNQPV